MDIKIYFVKAFTKNKAQGNPAGVIPDADNLTSDQMISIASALGFSESVFLQSSKEADYKARFFTSKQEVDLCGHATIAAFTVIREMLSKIKKEIILTQETKVGILPVKCLSDGSIMMTQKRPVFYDSRVDKLEIADLLGIDRNFIDSYPIQIVSTGTPKLLIPIKSLDILMSLQPNFEGISTYCEKSEANGFYPFTMYPETRDKNSDIHARQFNPLAGIDEDPITGVAAGALGAYIKKYNLLSKDNFIVEQGFIMNKAGKIYVDVSDEVEVGGYGTIYDEKVQKF